MISLQRGMQLSLFRPNGAASIGGTAGFKCQVLMRTIRPGMPRRTSATLSVVSRGDTLLRHQLEGRTLGTSAMVWDLTAFMEGLPDGRYVVAFESNLEVG